MPNDYRKPTLADLVLAQDFRLFAKIDNGWGARQRDNLRTAKKFRLDPQAASYLGTMLRKYPRIIADAQDFAIPPFERMWVEMPFPPFYEAVAEKPHDSRTGDLAVGYLFVGPTVRVAGTSRNGDSWFIPIEYTLHKPMTVAEELFIAEKLGLSRLGLDLWFWGGGASAFTGGLNRIAMGGSEDADDYPEWDKEGLRALRANHSVSFVKMVSPEYEVKYNAIVEGSMGDLRNIVGLLLFLNRTRDIQYSGEELPMAQTIINRKTRPMLPHRVIKLRLDPLPRLQRLAAGAGIRRRLHDVRGHFCHDRTAREGGCMHGVEMLGEWGDWWLEHEPLRWKCSGCGGHRWWRREHHRGHADVGVIREQRYDVTR